jgi:hypothetical protein
MLWSAIDFPAAEDVKCVAVHDEHAKWPVCAILTAAAERADVDAFWAALDSVRPRVAGLFEHLLGLDDPAPRNIFCVRHLALALR